jgi:hypothetical protein
VESRRSALEPYVAQREDELPRTVDRILDLLQVPEPRADTASLMIATIEGLTLSACLGRLSTDRVSQLAVAYVTALGSQPATGVATGQQTSVV